MTPGKRSPGIVCLTGPAGAVAAKPWLAAVAEAGWDAEHRPLVHARRVDVAEGAIKMLPSWVALTSANALPALVRLWKVRPDLKATPHAVVGVATGRQLESRGVAPELVATGKHAGAGTLAEALIETTQPGDRVLWPRGDRATELREHLVLAGRMVDDPIAYETVPIDDWTPPDVANVVFFASPSAVELWCARDDTPRAAAIAIGSTTYGALAPEYSRFSALHRLPQPTPEALRSQLEALAARR